jgi:uncharacterized membrane protein required for colicin V production
MRIFGTILHILGLIISGAVALFYSASVLAAVAGLAVADGDRSNAIGRLLGTLLIALIFIWVFMRFLRGLRAK